MTRVLLWSWFEFLRSVSSLIPVQMSSVDSWGVGLFLGALPVGGGVLPGCPWSYKANEGNRTPDRTLTKRLLYLGVFLCLYLGGSPVFSGGCTYVWGVL